MYDRLPTPGKENRVRITQDDGTIVEGVLSYADDATQEGSHYTKGNVLPDDVCGILGIDPDTSEPKDAWLGVIQAVGYSILTITVLKMDGSPMANTKVEGLTDIIEQKTYTDSNGKIFLILKEGQYTLSVPSMMNCVDASLTSQQVSITAGQRKNVVFQPKSNGATSLRITSTRQIKFSDNVESVDVFCVGGGGGGGGGGYLEPSSTANPVGGGGGGGGRTTTKLNAPFTPYTEYQAAIGAGGGGGGGGSGSSSGIDAGDGSSGRSGGITSVLGVSASGGNPGTGGRWSSFYNSGIGGDGGSGGGGGGSYGYSPGDGGTDGGNGESGHGRDNNGGNGQGRTTRAFGEPGGELFAAGGQGGTIRSTGSTGSNSGSGGGGGGSIKGGSSSGSSGRSGNSGIILLRWRTKT